MDEQLREYIDEWRKQRSKEEEELKRLKEKQAKRKEIRAEQEKKLAQQKKEEEERMRKEEADKKAKEAEEKRKRLEEAEKKRQAMMNAQKEKQNNTGKNCVPRSNLTTSFCPLIQAFMIFRFINRWRKSPKPWRGQRRRRTSRTNQNQRAIRRREKDFFKHPDQTFGCGFFGF